MRLVCPNCEAKYEVPEDAIPETGRDVQCANCGHAWYQMRQRAASAETAAPVAATPAAAPVPVVETPAPAEPVATVPPVVDAPAAPVAGAIDAAFAETAPADGAAADPVVAAPAPVADPAPEPVAAPAAEEVASADPVTESAAADAPQPEDPAPTPAQPAAYAVDESVLAILREEAQRESQARRAESRPLETQPDLGVDSVVAPVVAAVAPAAIPVPAESVEARPTTRRDLLPDVEEINSTLRPSERPDDDDAETADEGSAGRGSFRSGFLLVMTLAILGAALYLAAPMLRTAVPGLAGFLDAYVGFVDGMRLQLDSLMRTATAAIGG